MANRSSKEIFKQGSKTYYNSSIFFSSKVREDVFKFYSFVRVADDYVDSVPPQKKKFKELESHYRDSTKAKNRETLFVVSNIKEVEAKYNFDRNYMDSFLKSMSMDLKTNKYTTIEELLVYIYGSAEVIGLCMCKIIGVDDDGLEYAQMLGRSMQYINFIRDINEDIELGRVYMPEEILKKHGLESRYFSTSNLNDNENFNQMIREEIERYFFWQDKAEKGFKYIPYRSRIAIKTASDMYKWTAKQIQYDPQIVLHQKVKPSKSRIIITAIRNIFSSL